MQCASVVLVVVAAILFAFASLDPKQANSPLGPQSKCEPQCYQGNCVNGTCVCRPGWTGVLCESCFGRVVRSEPSGYLVDGPFNYSKNMRCTWFLDASEQNVSTITLRLDSFYTECCWDHVYIYDGDGVHAKQLAALSGIIQPSANGVYREYVAQSGQAYLFFFSDLAFNMSGFNISYKFSSCPKDCSGHGTCESDKGVCRCDPGWLGDACESPACSTFCVNGRCTDDRHCNCTVGYRGKFCNISSGEAVWLDLDVDGIGGRASYGGCLVKNQLWVVFGSRFHGWNFSDVSFFDLKSNVWTNVEATTAAESNSSTPVERYDHTIVNYEQELFMFGGVIDNKNVSCELWSFDLLNSTWKLINLDHRSHLNWPFHVAGHTAHVVNGIMIVIFGYNPFRGYLNIVQEYNFTNHSWNVPATSGASIIGSYGHSSVYDERSGLIYVYGGYGAASATVGQLYDNLYQYQPAGRKWMILRSSGSPTFLHSAALIGNFMLVVGGNGHNDSTSLRSTKCYSDTVLIYDIECAVWNTLHYPNYVKNGLARFGHRSFTYKESVYIYGGFNGDMLDGVIQFIPGNCSNYREKDSCINSFQGAKCVWSKSRCMHADDVNVFDKNEKNGGDATKSENSCLYVVSVGGGSKVECSEYVDCHSCTSSGVQPCSWCNGKCRNLNDCTENDLIVNQHSKCPASPLNCSTHHSCIACKLYDNKCTWDRRNKAQPLCVEVSTVEKFNDNNNVKDVLTKVTGDHPGVCSKPCAYFYSCDECLKASCLWCSTKRRCVDTNAYITSFPYGQCTQWTNLSEECANSQENCSSHLTCSSCRSAGPKCGWCDDGSLTGLGLCVDGGAKGPVKWSRELADYVPSAESCAKDHWFFFECPNCQCNGHAVCSNDTLDLLERQTHSTLPCYNCSGQTTGEQCEKCVDGYFGNALNGGNCTPCDCNNQATICNPLNGKCFCTTKGVSGHNCDKCEQKYIGDPKNQTCFYELTVDFVFTFNLNSEDDFFITKINFVSRPPKENTDVTFKLTCTSSSGEAGKVNLSVVTTSVGETPKTRRFLSNTPCHDVERRFSAEEFPFGTDSNTTFFVYMFDFKTPTVIQISFAQTASIDWMKFFVTFALCFFILLVLAFALWKIKQRLDLYRRRQRMFVEMAQMASRPFGSVQLDLTGGVQKQWASAISIEPCANYRAAVVTVALHLPTGGRKFAPNGQSGLAVASALCHIMPSQLAQLQMPPSPLPEEKSKRRRPACIS